MYLDKTLDFQLNRQSENLRQELLSYKIKPVSLILGDSSWSEQLESPAPYSFTNEQVSYLTHLYNYKSESVLATEIVKMFSHYGGKHSEDLLQKLMQDWVEDLCSLPTWSIVQSFRFWRNTSIYKPKVADIKTTSHNLEKVAGKFVKILHINNNVVSDTAKIHSIILRYLGQDVYMNWFSKCEIFFSDNILIVKCCGQFVEKYISNNYLESLKDIMKYNNITHDVLLTH